MSENNELEEFSYPKMKLGKDGFELSIEGGKLKRSELCVLVGPSGSGKSTFLRTLAGQIN